MNAEKESNVISVLPRYAVRGEEVARGSKISDNIIIGTPGKVKMRVLNIFYLAFIPCRCLTGASSSGSLI